MNIKKNAAIAMLLTVLGSAGAQELIQRLGADRLAQAGVQLSSWSVDEDRLTQISLPMAFQMPLGRDGKFYVSTSPAFSGLSRDTLSERLNGLSDVRLGGNTFLFNENWLLTFGVNLPSGKRNLTWSQYLVWRELIQPVFHYPVASYGPGLDLQLGLSTAWPLGDWMLGAGVGYLYKGRFALFDWLEDGKFDPGDALTLTLGLQRSRFLADVMFTYYLKDQLGGVEVFQSGLTVLAQVVGMWELDPLELTVLVRDQIKGKNKVLGATGLVTESRSLNANQFEMQATGRLPMQSYGDLLLTLDLRLYGNNDLDYGGAALGGPGVGIDWLLSETVVLNLGMKVLFGKVNTTAGQFNATGLTGQAGLNIQI